VLEDLPKVIQAVKEHGDADIKSAQLVGMDYHKEQPIKGIFTNIYYPIFFLSTEHEIPKSKTDFSSQAP